MPSKHTFTIKPISELIHRYFKEDELWLDPFAGFNSPCKETNDINPCAPTKYHLPASEFAGLYANETIDGVLFDPPYSPRQISESYKGAGLTVGMKDTQNALLYSSVRDALSPCVRPGGIVISFGWNSGGFGKKRGFEIVEILLVPHGGAHNDTIAVVEVKAK